MSQVRYRIANSLGTVENLYPVTGLKGVIPLHLAAVV